MKKIQIILLVEVQVLLVLLVLLYFNMQRKDQKMDTLTKKLIELEDILYTEELSKANDQDVVIGDPDAPNTAVMYTKYDCKYCDEFFQTTYGKLKKNLIDNGELKLVIRNMVRRDRPEPLEKARQLQQLYEAMNHGDSAISVDYLDSLLVTAQVPQALAGMLDDAISDTAMIDRLTARSRMYRSAGIRQTPTFIVNGTKLIGSRRYGRFKSLMENSQ